MRSTIYGLVDPREPSIIRYVGKTTAPAERLRRHRLAPRRKADAKTYRGKWIAKLAREGVVPIMVVLARVDQKHENTAERDMIRRQRAANAPLTNGSDGGEGGRLIPELQAKAAATLRAKFASGELSPPRLTGEAEAQRAAKIAASKFGDLNPMRRPDVIAKNRKSNSERNERLGRVAKVRLKRGTPEFKAMWSALVSGRKHSAESRKLMSEKAKRRVSNGN